VKRATALLLVLAGGLSPATALAEGGLRKGPWLMDLRRDSVVVMVEREASGPLHIAARAVGNADAGPLPAPVDLDDDVSLELHEINLRGLSPGTRYAYEVSGPGVAPTGGTFTTAPVRPAPFRFAIYGDTRSDPRTHRAVIEAVRRDGPDFVVHTGDLVADGREEALWQNFFDVAAPLLRDVPFVPVIGNHEFLSPMSSGAENYRRYVHFEPTGPSPELDAVFRFANARFVLTSSYDDWTGPSRDWLTRELEAARREEPDGWLFVVMHEGPRSSGPHGDSEALRDAGVDRLLRRLRVDLVISGHDHAYERGDDDGLRYMVSGGGGAPLYPRRSARSHSKVFRSEYHHVRVDVERDRAAFTAVRPDGTVLDRAVLRHDGWEDMRRDEAPPATPTALHATTPDAPSRPWVDFDTLVKFSPLFALVSVLAWAARRRAERK
jgi:predicted phosphodiesterase